MKLNEYQTGAVETAIYPTPLAYPGLGLCGEVGEFQEAWLAYDAGETEDTSVMLKEAGDVLWYLANVANDLGLKFSELALRKTFPKGEKRWSDLFDLLALSIEAGKIAEQVKKTIRDNGGVITPKRLKACQGASQRLLRGLADVLAGDDLTLVEAAKANNKKLKSRQERGKLTGDGDNR